MVTPQPKSRAAANVQKLSGDKQWQKVLDRRAGKRDLTHEAIKLEFAAAPVGVAIERHQPQRRVARRHLMGPVDHRFVVVTQRRASKRLSQH